MEKAPENQRCGVWGGRGAPKQENWRGFRAGREVGSGEKGVVDSLRSSRSSDLEPTE